MSDTAKDTIRAFIASRLHDKGDKAPFADTDSLFVSSRLDSLDAMETVVFLEESFGVNFADIGFDQTIIDSVNAIMALLPPNHAN